MRDGAVDVPLITKAKRKEKEMKMSKKSIWALVLGLVISVANPGQASVVADLNSYTNTGNLLSDLNSATAGGTWTFNTIGGGASEGVKSYSDAASDKQFQLDDAASVNLDYDLDFGSAVALNGTQVLSMDMALRRVASGSYSGSWKIGFYDSTGKLLFTIGLDGNTARDASKIFINTASASNPTDGLTGTTNTYISYIGAASTIATTDMTDFGIALGATGFDVSVNGVTNWVGINYLNTPAGGFGRINFLAGNQGLSGLSIDNLAAVGLVRTVGLYMTTTGQ